MALCLIESIRPGDLILTREGYKPALAAGCTGIRPVRKIISEDGRTLTGTPNHPIFSENGWTPLQNIEEDNYIMIWQNQKQLSSMELSFGVIPTPGSEATEFTTHQGFPGGKKASASYTKKSGRRHTAQFPKECTSTTRTETPSTTTSPTWNWSHPRNISGLHMDDARREAARRSMDEIIPLASAWHKSEEGRAWHSEMSKRTWINKPTFACTCQHCGNDSQPHFQQEQSFVATTASQPHEGQPVSMTKLDCARTAERSSVPIIQWG